MIISNWKKFFFTHVVPTFFVGGGDGSTQTTSTVTQSSVPDWLRPQTEAMLGGATQQIFNTVPNASGGLDITGSRPYVPYSTNPSDYVAAFSPLQQQSYMGAANMQMPGQFGRATELTTAGGMGGITSADLANYYGGQGAGYGAQGVQYGLGSAQQAQNLAGTYGAQGAGYGAQAAQAGQNFASQVTSPAAIQAYMNPYQQGVTDIAKQAAVRDYQTAQTIRQANAAKAGAFGGGRQAIENAEAQRNLNTQLQNLDVQGRQAAYNQALQNISQAQTLGLQGLQQGITGAGLGLTGVGQGINAGQLGLQGIGQGITGANAGLAGVQQAQAGYGLGTQAGTALSNIGTQQQAAQQGIYGLQNTYGQQMTQQQQDIINNAINNYAMAQQYPMQQLSFYNALLRGYATPVPSVQNYQAQPSILSQIGGLGATALGAYGALKAEGGKIEEPKTYKSGGLVDLAIANAMGEA